MAKRKITTPKLSMAEMIEVAHKAGMKTTFSLTPKTVLMEANDLIFGAREQDYGDAQKSFGRVAAMWAVILECDVTPEQVCLCMAALKMVRLLHQPRHRDSVIDLAGYAGCYEKVMQGEPRAKVCPNAK